ncbi:MAG: hypothetical protein AAGA30_11210 [Planctomycetota bacterium]
MTKFQSPKQIVVTLILLSCSTFAAAAVEQESKTGSQAAPKTQSNELFSDDFEFGLQRWETTDKSAWHQKIVDGRSIVGLNKRKSAYQPPVRSPHNIALIKDTEFESFKMTFDVKSTKDTGNHRDCCVFFGYQNDQQFYYVHLGAKPDPHSGQIMIVDKKPRRALTTNENPIPWDDQWHQVKLIRNVSSGMIQIFFDDMQQPIMSVSDKTFRKGRIGIGSFDDMNDFDNVKISKLED